MSQRHRSSKSAAPGAGARLKPSRAERTGEHRRVRHRVHQDLGSVDDIDDLVLDEPHHTGEHEVVYGAEGRHPVGSRRVRYWKLPFWKRRSQVRRERLTASRQLLDAD